MTATLSSIAISSAQFYYVRLGTEHTGDNQLIEGNALYIQTIVERFSDILQQYCGTRHQIRNRTVKGINMIIGISTDKDQFLLTLLCILTVLDRTDTPTLSCHNLYCLTVRECSLVILYTTDAMLLDRLLDNRRRSDNRLADILIRLWTLSYESLFVTRGGNLRKNCFYKGKN